MAEKINYHVTIDEIFSPLKAKSGIHIKPENKGKFTATKKATGKSTAELAHSSNAVTKKRAIFAQNAAKWHHADQGDQIEGEDDGGGQPHIVDLSTVYPLAKSRINTEIQPVGATPPDTDKAISHPQQLDNEKTGPSKTNPLGIAANDLLLGAGAVDTLLPYGKIRKQQIVRPQYAYNQHPYGTGSQAIMENGGDIARQISEDKAGAPRHYYHADDDYYEGGGPIDKTGVARPNTPSFYRRPNGQVIVPSYEFIPKGASKTDSTQYRQGFYNSLDRLKSGKLKPFTESAFHYGDFNTSDNEARNPGVDTMGAPDLFNMGAREGYMNNNPAKFTKSGNGGQYGGYQEDPQRFGFAKDESANRQVFEVGGEVSQDERDNLLVFEEGGELERDQRDNLLVFRDGGKAKYGYRVHQDPTRNTPTFDDGGYIRKLNSNGKVIPNIMEEGGALPSPEQRRTDRMYNQMWYEKGGIIPSQYGKDEDMNKLVFQGGGSIPGFAGNVAARYAGGAPTQPFKKKGKKMQEGGEMRGVKNPDYKKGKYLDSFNTNMLLTAEYADGGTVDPDSQFVDKLNYVLASGNRPQGDTSGFTPEQRELANSAYLWKQQNLHVAPEDVIKGFYGRPTSPNSKVDLYRQRISNIGYNPLNMYRSSPDAATQARQGVQNGVPVSSIAKYDQGGEVNRGAQPIEFHYGGGAEMISNNPYAGPTMEFKGPSHDDGGIGMSYGGKKVEVEGGETGVVDQEGDLNVMGNMSFPGTSTKFKSLSKKIASQENSVNRKFTKGQKLLDEADPNDAYDYLRYNSGRALTIGADMRMKRLAGAREQLGDIQKTILDTADRLQVEPQELSQGNYSKATYGKRVKAEAGFSGDPDKPPTRSDRNHNPGNIKYGSWAKQHGATGKDKDGFAIFGDDNVGLGAMTGLLQSKDYNNLSVKDAINKWTAGKPYSYDLGDLTSKRVGDLSQEEFNKVVGTMKTGEGTRYGNSPSTPSNQPNVPTVSQGTPPPQYNPKAPTPDRFHTNYYQAEGDNSELGGGESNEPQIPSSSKYNKLDINQFTGEIYSLATNRQIPVPSQKFQPQLLQPYQVSFQDRLNDNRDTFTNIAKQLDYNPSALSALGAQKYSADNAVRGEEFRTNQGISQDIANKNVEILNNSQLENLKLADTQMVRQATARAKTKAQTQEALNSVSSKILQHDLENRRMQLYEPLFDYRLSDSDGDGKADQFTYQGGPAQFNYGNLPGGNSGGSGDLRTKTIYDRNGQVRETQKTDVAPTQEALQQQRLLMNRRRLYLPPQRH